MSWGLIIPYLCLLIQFWIFFSYVPCFYLGRFYFWLFTDFILISKSQQHIFASTKKNELIW